MSDRRRQPLDQVLKKLTDNVASINLAEDIEEDDLGKIGSQVKRGYEIDDQSRAEWKAKAEKAMDAALQLRKPKNWPFEKSSNVKFPILTTAAIQFGSRAYPAIVDGAGIVKGQVIGPDDDGQKRAKADRVGAHMSWQLLTKMRGWEEDTDCLLHHLPIIGSCFRKVWRSEEEDSNKSEMVPALHIVINQTARSIETAPRVTQELYFYPYEIEEKKRAGVWLDVDIPRPNGEDEDEPIAFLEQQRRIDLDDDGYAEPYCVTVHKDTAKVVRIVANYEIPGIKTGIGNGARIVRIEPRQYWVHYPFLPDPQGGFYGIGFGHLLESITGTIDTCINQMIDAGTLQNAGGGFIGSGVRLGSGNGVVRFKPGEYKTVNAPGDQLRNAIVNMEHPGPSPVLFQLLGMMVEAAKGITAVQDIMTGDTGKGGQMQPTTALALIEQGMKVFTAIYKRIYRSLTAEFKLLFKLNSEHMDEQEYFTFAGEQAQIARADYDAKTVDIAPVADPRIVTDMQRLTRAQILMQFAQDPMCNGLAIRRRYLEAAGIDNIQEVLLDEQTIAQNQAATAQAQQKVADAKAEKDNASAINQRAGAAHKLAMTEKTAAETPHPLHAALAAMAGAGQPGGQNPQEEAAEQGGPQQGAPNGMPLQ